MIILTTGSYSDYGWLMATNDTKEEVQKVIEQLHDAQQKCSEATDKAREIASAKIGTLYGLKGDQIIRFWEVFDEELKKLGYDSYPDSQEFLKARLTEVPLEEINIDYYDPARTI